MGKGSCCRICDLIGPDSMEKPMKSFMVCWGFTDRLEITARSEEITARSVDDAITEFRIARPGIRNFRVYSLAAVVEVTPHTTYTEKVKKY